MSVILAIDCCLKLTGAALSVDGEIIAREQEDLGRRQSAELPLMAERVMHGYSWDALDYVALTNGPGYFTGLRVGAAYACGVAYASHAKIIPLSSLEILAHSSRLSGQVLAVVYAGHGYVYAQCKDKLEAGEYPVNAVRQWQKNNPDAKAVSDDPSRADIEALSVKPSIAT